MSKKVTLPHYQIHIRRWDEPDAKWHWSIVDMWGGGRDVAYSQKEFGEAGYDNPEEAAADAAAKLAEIKKPAKRKKA